jgi:flagellar hook-associated protein FlgK
MRSVFVIDMFTDAKRDIAKDLLEARDELLTELRILIGVS